jgi:hypothetical protein
VVKVELINEFSELENWERMKNITKKMLICVYQRLSAVFRSFGYAQDGVCG